MAKLFRSERATKDYEFSKRLAGLAEQTQSYARAIARQYAPPGVHVTDMDDGLLGHVQRAFDEGYTAAGFPSWLDAPARLDDRRIEG